MPLHLDAQSGESGPLPALQKRRLDVSPRNRLRTQTQKKTTE
jgi:hypothetical protein